MIMHYVLNSVKCIVMKMDVSSLVKSDKQISGNINGKSLFNIEKFEHLGCYEVKINIRRLISSRFRESFRKTWHKIENRCIARYAFKLHVYDVEYVRM